jgi:hypothetical protein
MAKQKLTGGGSLDLLTQPELEHSMRGVLRHAMQSWYREACIGTRFHRFSVQGTIVSNVLDMGGEKQTSSIGPADGLIWDIRRLHIAGLTAGDKVSIGINDTQPSSVITTSADVTGFTWLFVTQLILQPGESLKVYSTSNLTAGSGTVTLSGQVRELPHTQAWRLGGS